VLEGLFQQLLGDGAVKLHFPDLENRVRTAARGEMRRDKALWKQYKHHRKGWIKRQVAPARNYLVVSAVVLDSDRRYYQGAWNSLCAAVCIAVCNRDHHFFAV